VQQDYEVILTICSRQHAIANCGYERDKLNRIVTSMAWQRAASLKSIREGGVCGVELEGVPLALYDLDGTIYATHGVCTHAMALLAEGFVEDGKIECPLHQGLFDIRTGEALGPPVTAPIQTFAVKVDGDDLLVDLQRPAQGMEQAKEEARPDAAPAALCTAVADDSRNDTDDSKVSAMNANPPLSISGRYVWPKEGLRRIPDWVYTDQTIYEREVEKIFHGRTWNYVALECEVPNPGDFIRSNVGPTPVVVSRAEDGSIGVFENRCAHRGAEFCRELSGNAKEFVCPYHQWSYDLKGNLAGVPFRRGVGGKGGMPADFKTADHGLRKLNVTTHRGVVFASYCDDIESLQDYLGPEILAEFEATFDGRKPTLLGYYRHTLPGNWKLYHENLKDPYHATLLHTFLVTFGLLVAGNKSLMLADPTGRHGVMASAKSDGKAVSSDAKKEMRAYREGMELAEPRFMNFIDEFDSPWSVTMATIWPNLIIQREMNTLGVRQIVPTGPHEFIMKWTMFGFEGDDEEMTRHRLRQGNLMGPAGFLGLEDNEAIKFVQDGMQRVPKGLHLVELDPAVEAGTADTLISESAIRAMYQHWRSEMGL
jgi:apoptosis-inducing factor 3